MFKSLSVMFKDFPKQQFYINKLFRRYGDRITIRDLAEIEDFTDKFLEKLPTLKEPLVSLGELYINIAKAKISSYQGEYKNSENYLLKAKNSYTKLNAYQNTSLHVSRLILEVLENEIHLQQFIQEADNYILDKLDKTNEFSVATVNNNKVYYQKLEKELESHKDIYAFYNSKNDENIKLILQGFTTNILSHELKEHRRIFFNNTTDLLKKISNIITRLPSGNNNKEYNKEVRKYVVHPNILYKSVLETSCFLNFYCGIEEEDSAEILKSDLQNKIKLHTINSILNRDTITEFRGEFLDNEIKKNNHKYINFYVKSLDKVIPDLGNSVFTKNSQQLAEEIIDTNSNKRFKL